MWHRGVPGFQESYRAARNRESVAPQTKPDSDESRLIQYAALLSTERQLQKDGVFLDTLYLLDCKFQSDRSTLLQ